MGVELSPDTVVRYLDHALAAMDRCLDRFDDVTVNDRPHGPTTNSGAGLVVHACSAARYWLEHVGLGRPLARDRDDEFQARASVAELRALVASTGDRLRALTQDFDRASVPGHEWRSSLIGGDGSDASLVLHVLEELYQHLGHLELTADALARR